MSDKIKWIRYPKERGKLLFSSQDNEIHIYLVDNIGTLKAKYHVWDEKNLKTIKHVDTIKEAKKAAVDYKYYF